MGEHRGLHRQPRCLGGPRRASNRTPDGGSGRPEADTAVGDHERRVETELPERRQPVLEGLTRESSSLTDVSPVDVAITPAIPPSAHPPAKPTSKPALRRMRTHEIHESDMQKKS